MGFFNDEVIMNVKVPFWSILKIRLSGINKSDIPNCVLCKWREKNDIITGPVSKDSAYVCVAQGYQWLPYVYNNKICRKIYIKIIEKERYYEHS